jgi:hypothetical protein
MDHGKFHLFQFTTKKGKSYLGSEVVIIGSIVDNPLMIPSNSSTANGTEGHKCSSHPSVQHNFSDNTHQQMQLTKNTVKNHMQL